MRCGLVRDLGSVLTARAQVHKCVPVSILPLSPRGGPERGLQVPRAGPGGVYQVNRARLPDSLVTSVI